MLNGKERYSIVVDDLERRIIVQALSDLKDKQKSEGKNPVFHAADIGLSGTDYWIETE